MRKVILLIAIWTTAFAADGQIVVKGSTTLLPIAQACAEIFMDQNNDADITVMGGGSGVGLASLLDGITDIANTSRSAKDEEQRMADEKGIVLHETIVALDGIAIITNKSVGIDNITVEQLRGIFSGSITNWKEIGGPDQQIVVFSRDVSSGTFEVFKEKILDGHTVSDMALKVASNQAALTSVTDTPNSIGYIGLGYLNNRVKAPKINGIEPTKANAAVGKFPIVRPLYMYTNGAPTGLAASYIKFILSDEGQMLVDELGYVPVN